MRANYLRDKRRNYVVSLVTGVNGREENAARDGKDEEIV